MKIDEKDLQVNKQHKPKDIGLYSTYKGQTFAQARKSGALIKDKLKISKTNTQK